MTCSLKNYLHYYLGSSSVRLSIMNWFGHQRNTLQYYLALLILLPCTTKCCHQHVLELFLCAIMVISCKWQRRPASSLRNSLRGT